MVTELKTTTRALKAAMVLDAAAIDGLTVPFGVSKMRLAIAVDGRTVRAEVSAKELRPAVAVLGEVGIDRAVVDPYEMGQRRLA